MDEIMLGSLWQSEAQSNLNYMVNPASWYGSNPIDSNVHAASFYARPISAYGLLCHSFQSLIYEAGLYAGVVLISPLIVAETRQSFLSNNNEDVCRACYTNFEILLLKVRDIRDTMFAIADQVGLSQLRQQAQARLPYSFAEPIIIKTSALAVKSDCMSDKGEGVAICRVSNYLGSVIETAQVASPYFIAGCAALASFNLYNHWSSRISVEAGLIGHLHAKYQAVGTLLRLLSTQPESAPSIKDLANRIIANKAHFYREIAALEFPSLVDMDNIRQLVAPVMDQAQAIIDNG